MPAKKKYSIVVESEECKGCGRCVNACPKSLITMSIALNAMGYPIAEYCGDGCTGCGACFYACPEPGAISIHEEETEEEDS